MAEIELRESWADVAEPLRALMDEVERGGARGRYDATRPRGCVGAVGEGERRDSDGGASFSRGGS